VGIAPLPAELTKNPVDGFSAGLVDDSNLFEWQVLLACLSPPLASSSFAACC
jgi:hypothetical protein